MAYTMGIVSSVGKGLIRGWLEFNQYGTQGQFFRWSLPPMIPVSLARA
jgi:hypothetical protein